MNAPERSVGAVPQRSWRGFPLWLQVLVGIACGVLIGRLFPHAGLALKPLGDGFIKLIRAVLAPVIFVTVALGIARMGDLKEVGRVGLKAIIYFEIFSTVALLLGMGAATLLHPGRGMNIDAATLDSGALSAYTSAAATQPHGTSAFLLAAIPSSVGEAFTGGNMLQVIVLGVLTGLALSRLRGPLSGVITACDNLLHLLFGIIALVMKLAPIAAFGAMAFTVAQFGAARLVPLLTFTAELWAVSLFFVVAILWPVAALAGFSLPALLRLLREELLVTAGTASSEAVLAPTMRKLVTTGCPESIVGMVLPAGYTFNADGTAIYLAMGALFLAQATNTTLSLRDQVVLLAVLLLTSKGSAGVAGAGFVTLAATLSTLHTVPLASLVLLLGVERLTNIPRAVVNVIGSSVATLVIARWEGFRPALPSAATSPANAA